MRKKKLALALTLAAASAASAYTININNGMQLPRIGSNGYDYRVGDFDGDGIADIAQVDIHNHVWYVVFSGQSHYQGNVAKYSTIRMGLTPGGDVDHFVGDYSGDRKDDFGTLHYTSNSSGKVGKWYIMNSATKGKGVYPLPGGDYTFANTKWGLEWGAMDMKWQVVPGDFDGDGITDRAIVNKTYGLWCIHSSATNDLFYSPFGYLVFGWQWYGQTINHEIAVGDYDGDGKTDRAIVSHAEGTWYVIPSSTENVYDTRYFGYKQKGFSTYSRLAIGDYDGNGFDDYASFDTKNAKVVIHYNGFPGEALPADVSQSWSELKGKNYSTIYPVVGDYDGDGRADYAFVDLTNGKLHFKSSRTKTGSVSVTRSDRYLRKEAPATPAVENGVVASVPNFEITAVGKNLSIANLAGSEKVSVVDVRGKQVFNSASHGSELHVELPSMGKYIVRVGNSSKVVNVK